MEASGLSSSEMEELVAEQNAQRPEAYKTAPRYPVDAILPQPVMDDDVVVAWIIPLTMRSKGFSHTLYERWECAEDERFAPHDPQASRLLERIILRLINDRDIFDRCADALEAKIAAKNQGE